MKNEKKRRRRQRRKEELRALIRTGGIEDAENTRRQQKHR